MHEQLDIIRRGATEILVEEELVKKFDTGASLDSSIIGGKTQWAYFCRKLARAEKAGDPRLACW